MGREKFAKRHRRRSWISFRGHDIFARKMCMKNYQNARILHDSCPKNHQNTGIFVIFAEKFTKFLNFTRFLLPKMPKFYIIIARKIFFSNFFFGGGGHVPSFPHVLCLCNKVHVKPRMNYWRKYWWWEVDIGLCNCWVPRCLISLWKSQKFLTWFLRPRKCCRKWF